MNEAALKSTQHVVVQSSGPPAAVRPYRTFRHRIRRMVMSRFADIHTAAAANARLHSKRMHSRRIVLN